MTFIKRKTKLNNLFGNELQEQKVNSNLIKILPISNQDFNNLHCPYARAISVNGDRKILISGSINYQGAHLRYHRCGYILCRRQKKVDRVLRISYIRHWWIVCHEAHIWDKGSQSATSKKKGKQGVFDEEEAASRAFCNIL
ncbi:hypothetical protein BUALT_Bualt14G0070400 [Buddleja alternifolia]|uniref:Uncharacterized protein n=1 Tax=Buddleja alternifolia TaxID=168488 RepID=A0AAV6WSS6_9LAMI|nr:hypothetical protein BUALT_Bualt14G0070400 [Buddleja alternifolia]